MKYETGLLTFQPGNILDLKFAQPFDVVLAGEVIEHVAHPDQFLARLARLVRPGGFVVLTTPNGEYWRFRHPRFSDCEDPTRFEEMQFRPDADGHIFLLHQDEIERFGRLAGLELLRVRYFVNSLTNGHLKLSSALRILPPVVIEAFESATSKFPLARVRRLLHTHALAVFRRPASDPSSLDCLPGTT